MGGGGGRLPENVIYQCSFPTRFQKDLSQTELANISPRRRDMVSAMRF